MATVDAARIADADLTLDAECVLERAQVAQEASTGTPYLGAVGAYNQRWYVDAVALPHDAARRVLGALFAATNALHTISLDATARDIALYARLLHESGRFLGALVAGEEAALDAASGGALRLRGAPAAVRTHAETRLRLAMRVDALKAVARDAQETPALKLAARARAALHELATDAQKHFRAKEQALPLALRKRFRSSRARTRIEAHLLALLAREEGGLRFAALLVCSISSADVVIEFAARHFPNARRQAFLDAREALHATGGLLHIPVVFEEAAKKYAARFSIERFLEEYGRPHDVALVGQ